MPPDGTTFNQISLGDRLVQELPAYGYWNVQFYQMEPGFVNFQLGLPRGSSLGFYARRNALPTHTNYDLMKIVKGKKETLSQNRNRRASKVVTFWQVNDNSLKIYECQYFRYSK